MQQPHSRTSKSKTGHAEMRLDESKAGKIHGRENEEMLLEEATRLRAKFPPDNELMPLGEPGEDIFRDLLGKLGNFPVMNLGDNSSSECK
jgi:hypothetical protein